MQKNINEYQERSIAENKYFLLSSEYAKTVFEKTKNLKNYIYFFELFKHWDDYGSISLEIGQYIEQIIEDKNLNIGIHRTGGLGLIDNNNLEENELLKNIFTIGLKNNGDLSSGIVSKTTIHPNKTISMLTNPLTAIILLKSSYKDSKGAIITCFPSQYVDKNSEIITEENNIYYRDSKGNLIIKPEYLIGYIANEDGICTYYPKEKFLTQSKTK